MTNLEQVLKKYVAQDKRSKSMFDSIYTGFVDRLTQDSPDEGARFFTEDGVLFTDGRIVWEAMFELVVDHDIDLINPQVKSDIMLAYKVVEEEGWPALLTDNGLMHQHELLPNLDKVRKYHHEQRMRELAELNAELDVERKKLELDILRKKSRKLGESSEDEVIESISKRIRRS
jgi:hypothetical protein